MIDKNEIVLRAIKAFGEKMQLTVAMEELAELIKELSKYIRGQGSKEHIIEEMADVEIMLLQVKKILDISDKQVEEEILFKLTRLNNRINELERKGE